MSVAPNSIHPGTSRQAISRGIVALIKSYVGRGPTTARAYLEDDMVTVLLSDTLTQVEKTLTEAGSSDVVSTMRDSFDSAMCAEAVELIERETRRDVKAFMSGHAIEPDYSVFCFVLAPVAEETDEEPAPCDSPGLGTNGAKRAEPAA